MRHQINLAELTAVARQKDPKRKEQYVFGLFSPSRNYHLGAHSEKEAQEWVELIRLQARMDEDEEEIHLASPGGTRSAYHGFERSIDAHISPMNDDRSGYTSSDAEILNTASHPLPKPRDRENTSHSTRRPSGYDYSGPEHGSYSDFSDAGPAACMSALSLANTDGRPSTSSTQQPAPMQSHSVYGQMSPSRPSMGPRNLSQLSGLGAAPREPSNNSGGLGNLPVQSPHQDDERVIYHGWLYLLKSKSGVRQWKKVWMVLRPKALALYKNGEEYTALLVLPFPTVIDVVEIDAISRSKTSCMQVICEERNYRFCAPDEESLARWVGAFKSVLRFFSPGVSTLRSATHVANPYLGTLPALPALPRCRKQPLIILLSSGGWTKYLHLHLMYVSGQFSFQHLVSRSASTSTCMYVGMAYKSHWVCTCSFPSSITSIPAVTTKSDKPVSFGAWKRRVRNTLAYDFSHLASACAVHSGDRE